MSHPDQVTAENGSLRRSAARTTILEAARQVTARVGTIELSLSSVATEAGFNASTVFGHFRNKDELLIAVLADDLANMGAIMRGTWPQVEAELPEQAAGAEAGEPDTAVPDFALDAPSRASDSNIIRLYATEDDKRQTEDIGLSLEDVPTLSNQQDGYSRGDLGQVVDGIECRLKALEADASGVHSFAEHGAKALFDRIDAFERQQNETLHDLLERTEDTARRQREATAEMRAAFNDTATRIEVLESQKRAEQSAPFGKISNAPDQSSGPTPPPPQQQEDIADTPAEDSYRNAADRAASAAATLATIDAPIAEKTVRAEQRRAALTKPPYFIAAFVVAMVFVAAAFVAFFVGRSRGHDLAVTSLTLTHVQAQARSNHTVTGRQSSKSLARDQPALQESGRQQHLAVLALQGSAGAELAFGLQLLRGDNAPPNKVVAAQWVRRAAEKRNAVAQYWLGTLYEHGDGVAPDAAEAVRWYEAAAIQGNRKAMHALGIAYAQGLGTQKNYSDAARWFAGAAELGLVNSQFNLGVLYERGLGVPQNLLNAYKWYAVAGEQGDQESKARVTALKTQLNADDLAVGERAAQSFRAQAPRAEANDIPAAVKP